jgi:UDP-2,3-diacylglucosamine pyrophosphatase LpxH
LPTFVLSDLHLDAEGAGRLFDDGRQGVALAELCSRLAEGPRAELVLLGDTFDLTAMLPPERGLETFSRRVECSIEPSPRRSTEEMLACIARDNPVALRALTQLSNRIPVFVVPGNHDRQLGEPGGAEALSSVGLGAVRLAPFLERSLEGKTVVLMHGNEFDPGNAEAGGPGEAMTACMHHAVIPFLRKHGARRHARMDPDRVVTLRPEEAVVTLLQRWLEPDVFKRFFNAFLELLAENEYMPHALAFLARLVPADQVRGKAAQQDRLWERAGDVALSCLRGERDLPREAPRPDIFVLGHTHVLDWAVEDGDRLYVNLGTWTERASDVLGPFDLTLPLLELRLHDGSASVVLRDLDERGGELQRYELPAASSTSNSKHGHDSLGAIVE